MRVLLLAFLYLFFCFYLTAQSLSNNNGSTRVSFILHAPSLPDTAKVFITGNCAELGYWDPAKVSMRYSGNHTWRKDTLLQEKHTLEYKYTLGSWERQATNEKGQPFNNFSIKVSRDTIVEDKIEHWSDGNSKKSLTGGVRGTLKYHKDIASPNLPKRDLVVWLPPGYDENKSKHYPVLYMHDGQNIFDPATSSFGVDWRIDETADSLIRAKVVEPVIVVGIYNTPDRMEEYIPGDKGTAYMDFLVNQVKPLIDHTYRTKPKREHTLTGGSSAGGTISFMLAWEYPHIFSKAICMSPAFNIQHIDYVKNVMAYTGRKKNLYLYIDNGGIELEEKLQPGIDEMLAALRMKGYKEGKDFIWIKAPEDKHNEAAWARRMPNALKLCLPH